MRSVLVLLGLFALALALLMSLGLISVGGGKLPEVTVAGGEAPSIDAGSIDVGTENKTIQVPTIDVQKAPGGQ